jgi:hypothetical protein
MTKPLLAGVSYSWPACTITARRPPVFDPRRHAAHRPTRLECSDIGATAYSRLGPDFVRYI